MIKCSKKKEKKRYLVDNKKVPVLFSYAHYTGHLGNV